MSASNTETRTGNGPAGGEVHASPHPVAGRRFPFTGVEETWQLRTPPDETANVQLELRFSGALDESRLKDAATAALAFHPMARARRVAGRFLLRPPVWEIGDADASGMVDAVGCRTDSEMAEARVAFYDQTIDLGRSPALRLRLARRPGGDSLLLNAHHAVTDGMGALRFLHSLAFAYDGRPDPPCPVDPLAVREPKIFRRAGPPQPLAKAEAPRPLPGTRAFIASEGARVGPGFGFHHVTLPAELCRQLDPRRFEPTATVNDLLMGALHRTIAAWNACRNRPCESIAVFMPANARPPGWRQDVVGNFAAGAKITTAPSQRATPASLMDCLTRQTRWLKSGATDDFARDVPGWAVSLFCFLLPAISRVLGDRVENSAVLSNLGRLDDPPDFGPPAGGVTEVWFSPPCGMPMGLAVGVTGLQGRLHIVFRYRRALLDEAAAARFAGLFLDELADLGSGVGTAAMAPGSRGVGV